MTEPFFPNQSPSIIEMEQRFRAEAAKLPERSRLTLYEIFSSCTPGVVETTFRIDMGMVIASQIGREIAFPSPTPMVKLSHIVFGYEEWLRRKYCLPGFVEVEPGDIVVDCGAYVGGFSISAARLAAQVHAFEPDIENFACMKRNIYGQDGVFLNCAGLYSQTGRMNLNISSSSVEHSLIAPDNGEVVEVREVDIITLSDYFRGRNIRHVDFVKLEAEGVELEAFDGLKEIKPLKFAIDVSPERNGESPAEEFLERLAGDYETHQRGNVMFAKRRP